MVGLKELKDLNSILFSFKLTTIVLTTLSSSSAVSTSLSLRANAKMELIFRFRRVKFLKGDPEPILGCGKPRASWVSSRLPGSNEQLKR